MTYESLMLSWYTIIANKKYNTTNLTLDDLCVKLDLTKEELLWELGYDD